LDEYLRANNNFTVNLFQKLYSRPLSDAIDDQVNLIFSPHSVWQAVVLSYLLSSGEMEAMLGHSMGVESFGKVKF
jgi:serine protease inhibitor